MTAPPPADLSNHVVVDASAVVALLVDAGPAGEWASSVVAAAALSAPELMPYEAGNVLRRRVVRGAIEASMATHAHDDLLALDVDYYPYHALAGRVWELRGNLTVYDAAYVALAEWLAVPFVTLDARIARASGVRCQVRAYPDR